jgi:hypothetical protein
MRGWFFFLSAVTSGTSSYDKTSEQKFLRVHAVVVLYKGTAHSMVSKGLALRAPARSWALPLL